VRLISQPHNKERVGQHLVICGMYWTEERSEERTTKAADHVHYMPRQHNTKLVACCQL